MSYPPLSNLLRRASELTARNVHGDLAPAPPPPYVAENPLLEVLVEEVAAKLPGEVARELRSGAATGQFEEWLAAGTLYTLVREDTELAQQFLERLAGRPKEAALSLARTLASRMGPPPMPASWFHCDLLGVMLQFSALSLFFLARVLLLGLIARDEVTLWFWPLPPLELAFVPPLRFSAPAWLAWLGLWFGIEAVVGPRAMEFLRRLPARLMHQPVPLSWRVDTLHLLCALQSFAMLVLTLGAVSAPLDATATCRVLLACQLDSRTAVSLLLLPVVFAVTADLRYLVIRTGTPSPTAFPPAA